MENKKKQVQIGAGLSSGPSWTNYDNSPTLALSKIPLVGRFLLNFIKGPKWPGNVLGGDILRGLPLKKNSCKLIFCSHVLEHLGLSDFNLALQNIYDYLEPKGIFRLIVPDLEIFAKRYVEKVMKGPDQDLAAIDFMRGTLLGFENSRKNLLSRVREALENSRHQWLWDKYSLRKALENHGFHDICQRQFGEWADPLFSEIEDPKRHIDSICFECQK